MPVYFVQAGEGGPVKIGCSDEHKKRLRRLQSLNHAELKIIRVVEGDRETERWFHKQFVKNHIRGEWFAFSEEMLSFPPGNLLQTKWILPRVKYKNNHRSASSEIRDPALNDAIYTLGGPEAACRALGVTKQALSQWEKCPALRVIPLEKASGVSRYRLRPDIFGPPPERAA